MLAGRCCSGLSGQKPQGKLKEFQVPTEEQRVGGASLKLMMGFVPQRAARDFFSILLASLIAGPLEQRLGLKGLLYNSLSPARLSATPAVIVTYHR